MVAIVDRVDQPISAVVGTYFAARAFFRLDRIANLARGIVVSDYFDRLALDRALDTIGDAERRAAAHRERTDELKRYNTALEVAGRFGYDDVVDPADTGLAKVGGGAVTLTVDEATGNITSSPAIGGIPTEGNFDIAASKVVLAEGQPLIGWPILGVAHLMV